MITITQTFKNGEDMHNFIIKYLYNYAPAGYNTQVEKIEFSQTYDEWLKQEGNYKVTITRWESCD